jgi:glycosyltransferase involved in cell wall biosynthesis
MGHAGRQRAISEFDWTSIALQTAKLYHEVAGSTLPRPPALPTA